MNNDNIVIFKGSNDGITIILDEKIEFVQIKNILKKKLNESKKFFSKAKVSLKFKGRDLSEEESNELINIVSNESELVITFVKNEPMVALTEKNLIPEAKINNSEIALNNITMYHQGSIRSGQSLRYVGSIVIIGDVNPGGEVIAEGNIVVLGALKGLVHAGCSGNEHCFVSAINLIPTQIRIGSIITYLPNAPKIKGKKKDNSAYAYIKEGQIYIAPLT